MHEKFYEQMSGREHNFENWREVFDAVREKTALGVHDVRMVAGDEESITLEMPIGDHARQVVGLLHGGVSAMLAESAASLHACWGLDIAKRGPVGIEVNITHLRAATEGTVHAIADLLKRGRTHVRHRVEIRHVERDLLLSDCRVTNFIREHGAD